MFDFLKIHKKDEAASLVDELAAENGPVFPFKLKNFQAGAKILAAGPQVQRQAALGLARWIDSHASRRNTPNLGWKMRQSLGELLERGLAFDEDELLELLDWSLQRQRNQERCLPQLTRLCADFLKDAPPADRLQEKLARLAETVRLQDQFPETLRQALRLNELAGCPNVELPFSPGDAWADAAAQEIGSLPAETQKAWQELLLHCLRPTAGTPGARWLKDAETFIQAMGAAEYQAALERWFRLVERPRPAASAQAPASPGAALALFPVNSELLKGLVWTCVRDGSPGMARALSGLAASVYRKIPGVGPRSIKVGNACVWVLGEMPGGEGLAQLSILKARIKISLAQRMITSALDKAAWRAKLSVTDVEELTVPTYGLQEVGLAVQELGETRAELRIEGNEAALAWSKAGKKLASAPRAAREQFPAEIEALNQSVKDIRKMLPAQRDRIDNLFLQERRWKLADWRERYLDHPLVGSIARRLVWKFSRGDWAASGIWWDGLIVGRDEAPLDWLDAETSVELWHPLQAGLEAVLGWRDWLVRHEVRQPFKQAHREVYLLTDAERATSTYSNRFAAHILRQHQFNALCAARGWKNSLRLMVDDSYPPAYKVLPAYGLRAEYWIEGIGTQYGTDTLPSGAYIYLTTDQVRFYPQRAQENRAHAGGGGYSAVRWDAGQTVEALPLDQVPPLALSEVFRDVDLFVGVASVGSDPTWLDTGSETRYRDYWHNFSFGELGETARTRRQILENLVPRLKIGAQCQLSERFLVVRGSLRTYKIHLGSGNILMEPNDQYLCIVPRRSAGP